MIHNKFRYLLTLVALFAISTGAWADYTVTWEGATLKSVNVASYGENNKTQTIGDITVTANLGYFKDFGDNGVIASAYEANGLVFSANAKFISVEVTASSSSTFNHTSGSATSHTYTVNPTATSFALPYGDGWIDITKIVFTFENAPEPPIEVTPVAEPAANTKQWTFAMPGSDVVLTPQYAPAAQLDENGAPAAVSGLEIAADAAIITAGQSAQGTLLYAVGTSATEKPALTAFAATLPNAKDLTAAGNYYVWYYIQGQDTPQGQEPTAENTFNDSEIMGPVMVELLTNEHTLNIKQSPNITVTVAGTAKAVTDDKVTPVTTGQEVKIKAKDGYKFRKVEAVKVTYAEGHALPLAKFGEIVCSDGKAYAAADKDNLPKGVKAEALVCYVNGDHGLALAMADVKNAKMSWDNDRGANDGKTAAEWCDGWNTSHPIAGATWLLASQTQWNNMISAAGSASNLSNAFSAVGGTNLQAWSYWSSTPNHGGSAAYLYYFPSSSWQWVYLNGVGDNGCYIRACLEW